MGRQIIINARVGGGSPAEFLLGEAILEPTRIHSVGDATVFPSPTPAQVRNGVAVFKDVQPSPDGPLPEWCYRLTVRDTRSGKAWSRLVGVPSGVSDLTYNRLPVYDQVPASERPALVDLVSTAEGAADDARRAREDADISRQAAQDAAALVNAPAGDVVRTVVEADLKDENSESSKVLQASFAQAQDTLRLLQLATVGASDQVRSSGRAQRSWDSSQGFTENWDNVSRWTQANLVAGGNHVYSSPGYSAAGAKRFLSDLGKPSRIVGQIKVVAPGSGTRMTLIGVNTSPNDSNANTIGSPYFLAIGVREDGIPISFRGSAAELSDSPLPVGTYYVSIILTEVEIAMSLHNADGSIMRTFGRSRAETGMVTHVAVWNTDTRGMSGNGVGPIVARAGSYATGNPVGIADEAVRWTRYAVPERHSEFTMVATPRDYDSRKPSPVVIYAHGHGDNELDATLATRPNAIGKVTKALVDAGFIVAAGRFGGTANWGNAAAVEAMQELYRHLRDAYHIGPVVLMGHSMGGLVSLTSLAQRKVPNIVGFVGIEPVVSLRAAYDGNFGSSIRSTFGISSDGADYTARTSGFDPALRAGWEFRGVPMWLTGSPNDTSVPQDQHVNVLRSMVSGFSGDVTFHQASGPHVDPTHFQPTAVVNFCKRVTQG